MNFGRCWEARNLPWLVIEAMVAQRGTGDVGFLVAFGDNAVAGVTFMIRAGRRIGVSCYT